MRSPKLMLEVSKLIHNVGSTAAPFMIPDQANYTKDDVTRLGVESSKHLKNHLMKTVYINKLQPEYKDYVLSREPANFQEANNYVVALWKRKNPEGVTQKPSTVFAIESDFGLNQNSNLSEEEREICINALKNSRNNGQNSRQNSGFSNYSSNSGYSNTQQSKPKKDKKKKENATTLKR